MLVCISFEPEPCGIFVTHIKLWLISFIYSVLDLLFAPLSAGRENLEKVGTVSKQKTDNRGSSGPLTCVS